MITFNKKSQCKVDCIYKKPNSLWYSIFKPNKPLCNRYQKNDNTLDIDFPILTKKQLNVFNENFKSYKFPKSSKNGLVIVETRKDKRLEAVLKNIAYYVPNWKLHIFHSANNKEFIKNILKNSSNNIVFHELKNPIKSNQDYNFVLKDISFWEKLTEHERVLVFQTDSLILRFGIEEFLNYDYIGAPWPWWQKHFKNISRMGGNGGFSIRHVGKMIETLEKYGDVGTAPINEYQNEDVFFSYHLYFDKTAILPNWNTAMLFASETSLCDKTLGVHQAWRFHKNFKLKFN